MTNSPFEKGETKERESTAERWMRLFLLSEQRAEISPFPRSWGILGELADYKDKGSRDFSGYSSPANSGWKRRRRRRVGVGVVPRNKNCQI